MDIWKLVGRENNMLTVRFVGPASMGAPNNRFDLLAALQRTIDEMGTVVVRVDPGDSRWAHDSEVGRDIRLALSQYIIGWRRMDGRYEITDSGSTAIEGMRVGDLI